MRHAAWWLWRIIGSLAVLAALAADSLATAHEFVSPPQPPSQAPTQGPTTTTVPTSPTSPQPVPSSSGSPSPPAVSPTAQPPVAPSASVAPGPTRIPAPLPSASVNAPPLQIQSPHDRQEVTRCVEVSGVGSAPPGMAVWNGVIAQGEDPVTHQRYTRFIMQRAAKYPADALHWMSGFPLTVGVKGLDSNSGEYDVFVAAVTPATDRMLRNHVSSEPMKYESEDKLTAAGIYIEDRVRVVRSPVVDNTDC